MTCWLGEEGETAGCLAVMPAFPNLGGEGARTTRRGPPNIATPGRSFMLMFSEDVPVYTRFLTHPVAHG